MNLRLMRPIIATLSILLLALIFPVFAQDGVSGIPFSQAPYRVGERLTYNISYSHFPSAAHVEVQVVARGTFHGRDAIQLRAHVETIGMVNVALFAFNKDFVTYIEPDTGLPFHSESITRDAIRADETTENSEDIGPQQRIVPGTYDLLSAFYRARAMPLTTGAKYNFPVRGESADYQVEIKIVGRQTVQTSVGSFETLVADVRGASNSPLKNLKIYFSEDERHIPVLATARVSGGDLRAELAGAEFVKPPTPAASPVSPAVPKPTPKPTPTPSAPPAPANLDWPFSVGEQLNYQVFLGPNAAPVGQATFQVTGRSRYFDRDGIRLSVKAQTTGTVARVFVANDQIDSYVDPKALLPYRSVFNLIEGQRRLNQTLVINQDTGTATTDKGQRIEIPIGTHDYLSFFYALRSFNLNPQKRNAVSMLVENKPKTLFVSALKRESIQMGERKVPAIMLSITTDDPQSDKYQMRIWVSDDKRRLPLRITCATQLGPVRADLAVIHAAQQ